MKIIIAIEDLPNGDVSVSTGKFIEPDEPPTVSTAYMAGRVAESTVRAFLENDEWLASLNPDYPEVDDLQEIGNA